MTCLKLFTFNQTSKKIKKKIYFFCDAKCYEMLSRNIYLSSNMLASKARGKFPAAKPFYFNNSRKIYQTQ